MTDCLPCLEDKNHPSVVASTAMVDGVNVCDRHRKIAELRRMKNAPTIPPMPKKLRTLLDDAPGDCTGTGSLREKNPDWSEVQRDRDAGLTLAAVIIKHGVGADEIKRNTTCKKPGCATAQRTYNESGKGESTMSKEKTDWTEIQARRDSGEQVSKIAKDLGCSDANVYLNTSAPKRRKFDKATAGAIRSRRPMLPPPRSNPGEKILKRAAERDEESNPVDALNALCAGIDDLVAKLEDKKSKIDALIERLRRAATILS